MADDLAVSRRARAHAVFSPRWGRGFAALPFVSIKIHADVKADKHLNTASLAQL